MIESIVFVIRRMYWEAEDESHLEYLTSAIPLATWTRDIKSASLYQSAIAFHDAAEMGGRVFLRMPSGREIPVTKSDFVVNTNVHRSDTYA